MKKMLSLLKEKICVLCCSSKKQKWHKSNWQILLKNSFEYLKMMEIANDHKINNQVLHNGHIAVELIVKAAISKNQGRHPDGHEIRKLTQYEVLSEKILLNEINEEFGSQKAFNQIYSAWKMQYRYNKISVSRNEAEIYYKAYWEAFSWIKNKYC